MNLLLLVGASLLSLAWANRGPEYIYRDPDKLCLANADKDSPTLWCLPDVRPENCTDHDVFEAHQTDPDLPKCLKEKTG